MGKKKSKEDDRALTPAEERRVKEYEASRKVLREKAIRKRNLQ